MTTIDKRNSAAYALAQGHAFAESVATQNVCGVCGAHRDYHHDNPLPITRRVGLAYLNRDGDLRVPCSRYGSRTADCAPIAWRVAYLVARETGSPITYAALEHAMGLVVNDHDDVAYMVRNYGRGHYV